MERALARQLFTSRKSESRVPFRRKALFEAIEARLLLSADLTPVAELGLLQADRASGDVNATTETRTSIPKFVKSR